LEQKYKPDFICFEKIIVEIKAMKTQFPYFAKGPEPPGFTGRTIPRAEPNGLAPTFRGFDSACQ
jgi:hypothetical protein